MKKNHQVNKVNKVYRGFYLLLFIMVLMISYFFPYTHDDWAWGSSIGIERLNSLFDNYNGRWVGNLLVMFLTRNRIMRAIIIALSLVAIVYLIQKIVDRKNNKIIILSAIILLLTMPISVFAQAVAWTSGFANYVIPIIIILFYLYFNKNLFSDENIEIKNRWIIPFALLGFINSLFVEHATLYNVLLSIVVILYYLIRKHKIVLANLFYMIGSILGTVLMFSNEAYHTIFQSQDTYRAIEQDNIIIRFFRTFINELADYLIYRNKPNKMKEWKKNILKISTFVIAVFLSYILYKNVIGGANVFIYKKYRLYLEAIMAVSFAIALVAVVLITISDRERKKRILFEAVSIVVLAAPLLIVNPIGPRCFFPTYILFVLIVCELLDIAIEKEYTFVNEILCMISLIFCVFIMFIYGYCFKIETERINYINNHKLEMELTLPKIPFVKYMQVPNPGNEVFIHRFKLFYGLNTNAELNFVDYKEWKEK